MRVSALVSCTMAAPSRRQRELMTRTLLAAVLAALLKVDVSSAYCATAGHNPGFSEGPVVQQLDMTRVRVSWKGIVTQRSCTDQFLVKYWPAASPSDYKMSKMVTMDEDFVDIDKIMAKITYQYQAVAREDKGWLGTDWNKSPLVEFKTSRYNVPIDEDATPPAPTTAAPQPQPEQPDEQQQDDVAGDKVNGKPKAEPAGAKGPETQSQESQIRILGQPLFQFIAIVVGCAVGLLIIIGIVYSLTCGKRGKGKYEVEESDEDEDDPESGMGEDEESAEELEEKVALKNSDA